jgi:hypothetical protein
MPRHGLRSRSSGRERRSWSASTRSRPRCVSGRPSRKTGHQRPIQADLEAAGTVDKEGGHHLEIQLTGPDTQDRSIYGTQDKYLLHAYSKDYDLAAGDSQFNLSPLTEQYLSARGIGVSASYKGLSVKGFSQARPGRSRT